jgi:hypothetical protein
MLQGRKISSLAFFALGGGKGAAKRPPEVTSEKKTSMVHFDELRMALAHI